MAGNGPRQGTAGQVTWGLKVGLYSFPRASVTKYHKLNEFKHGRNISSHSGGQMFKINVSVAMLSLQD